MLKTEPFNNLMLKVCRAAGIIVFTAITIHKIAGGSSIALDMRNDIASEEKVLPLLILELRAICLGWRELQRAVQRHENCLKILILNLGVMPYTFTKDLCGL